MSWAVICYTDITKSPEFLQSVNKKIKHRGHEVKFKYCAFSEFGKNLNDWNFPLTEYGNINYRLFIEHDVKKMVSYMIRVLVLNAFLTVIFLLSISK